MLEKLGEICDDAQLAFDDIIGVFEFENHCKKFDQIVTSGYRDEVLTAALTSARPKCVLFTGGGILPSTLLDIPGATFLHVHPGFLPEVRGADGLLWSMVTRGCPGASCFKMAPGIDCGDIVAAAEFPPLMFDISGYSRPSDKLLYRAIFSFYDPILRAILLTRTIMDVEAKLDRLPIARQDLSNGVTYHFMHEHIRRQALRTVCRSFEARR